MTTTAPNSVAYSFDVLCRDFPLKATVTCGISVVSYFAGGIDQLVSSLFLLMVLDFGLGFSRGWHEGNISGDKMKHGAIKFIIYGISVYVAVLMQTTMQALDPSLLGIRFSFAVRDWLLAYLVLNESISCMEHLVYFKAPLPISWIKRLKNYRGCIFAGKSHEGPPAQENKPKEDE
jgi:phage-related holin